MALTRITKGVIKPNENYDTHNINSTGIITAIGFKGPFTGSSDIQSGILTATKIDLNGDIDVDGHTNLDNVSIAGVTTAAGAIDLNADLDVDGHTNLDNVSVAGVSTFSGDATFSGNVSIGGTLTYEDVTNIDSVGIVTARNGIKVLAGGANVVGVVTATSFVGALPISNDTNNRVLTGTGSGGINGETNLTFDHNQLFINCGNYSYPLVVNSTQSSVRAVIRQTNDGNANSGLAIQKKHSTLHPANHWYGDISFEGWDGSGYHKGGLIECVASGTPANDNMPGELRFSTNSGGTGTTKILTITKDGKLYHTGGGDGRRYSFAGDGTSHYMKMDTTLNGIILNGYGGIAFETNGTNERLRITSAGKVGIGLTNPDQLLHIASTGTAKFRLTDKRTSISVGSQYGVIQFEQRDSNTPGVSLEMAAVMQDTTNGNTALQIKTGTPSTIAERLRITGHGYVGVKRSTPLANLHITNNELALGANPASAAAPNATYDGLVVDGSAGSWINIRSRGDGNSAYGRLAFSDDVRGRAYVEYRHKDGGGDDTMRFAIAGSERLRITNDGKFSLGTINASPSAAFHLDYDSNNLLMLDNHSASTQKMFFASQGATHAQIYGTTSSGALTIESDPSNNHSSSEINFKVDNVEQMVINNAGVGIGTDGTNGGLWIYRPDAQIRLYDTTTSGSQTATRIMAYNGVTHFQSGTAFSSDSKAPIIFGSMFGGTEWARIDTSGRLAIGDGNELASTYASNLLVDGGAHSKVTMTSASDGTATISFSDASTNDSTKNAGFIQMNHSSSDNGPRLKFGLDNQTKIHIRNPGSQRGQLELYGNFNEESTPALEINDGGDARKAYMSNTSGDLVLWTRNASRIGGKLKMFESGTLRYDRFDPDNSANLHKCFQASNYKVTSGSTNQSTTYTTQYIIAGGFGSSEGMYCGRTNFTVNAANNDHYQPVAFVPMGYNLDSTSFGGHWFGDVWINQSGSQKPSDFGGTNTNWATMSAQIKWDSAHWNAKPQLSSVVHYVSTGQANIGRLFFSSTQAMWIGWFLPGYYAVQYRVNKGISVHTATSAGGSILVRHSSSFFTASSMAYSSRNTAFDSAIMYGGNGSHST